MSNMNLLGQTLGRFEILAELGRGGMAVVYRARQTDLERIVALKVLPPELSFDKSYIARFLQEARSVAALEHPHIVPIYEIGEANGFHYIAMKYIGGRTLKELVEQQGRVDIQQATTMLEQIAKALDYAHSRGVIHRDIKPSNMMIDTNGWVYLTDFGLARGGDSGGLTMAGTVMGTPEYMSPEQAQGLPTIGPPTDIYALGVVLYELLTGKMPFEADTPMGMLVARLQRPPRPPREYRNDLALPVEDVIMRALARKPEARFSTATDLVKALRDAAGMSGQPFVLPQRPVSPAQGVPVSDNRTPPTPPYVVKANVGPTEVLPRAHTPPVTPVAPTIERPSPFVPPTVGSNLPPPTVASQPRLGKAIWIVGAVLLLAVLIGGGVLFMWGRGDGRAEQLLNEAQIALVQEGDLDKAISTYQEVLAIEPDNAHSHAQLALIYNLRSRFEEAEQEARAAINANDTLAFAYAQLAEALNNQYRHDEALEEANRAIDMDGTLSLGYAARAGVRADRAVAESDDALLEEAITDAEEALISAEDEDTLAKALAHSASGYVYWQRYLLSNDQSNIERGIEEFNKAIGLQSKIALFHSNLGYFYNAQGNENRNAGDETQAVNNFERAKEKI